MVMPGPGGGGYNQGPSMGGGRCGNGIVDDGEDCDCGSDTTCSDNPCCSSYTCRLNIDAQCSDGECCQNCKVILLIFKQLVNTKL